MKKSILFFAVCFTVSTVSFGFGKDASEFSIVQNGSVVELLYKSSEASDVKVSIFDSKDHELFAEVFKSTGGFSRPYNLGELAPGEYFIEVEDEAGLSRRHVIIEDKRPEKGFKAFKVARIFEEDGKLLLTVGRSAKEFSIAIIDRHGKTVYSESKILKKDFAQVYNIRDLKGDVTVIVTDAHGNEEKVQF